MNGAQLHLLLNHFPILGTLFGLLVLAAGLWKKSEDLQKAALVCFLLPEVALRSLGRVSYDRAWELVMAGVAYLAIGGLLCYLLWLT